MVGVAVVVAVVVVVAVGVGVVVTVVVGVAVGVAVVVVVAVEVGVGVGVGVAVLVGVAVVVGVGVGVGVAIGVGVGVKHMSEKFPPRVWVKFYIPRPHIPLGAWATDPAPETCYAFEGYVREAELSALRAERDKLKYENENWHTYISTLEKSRDRYKAALTKIRSCELSVAEIRGQSFKDAFINMADRVSREALADGCAEPKGASGG